MNEQLEVRPARAAGALWTLACVLWLVGEAVTASAFPGYDYATNYISDLGIPDVGTFQGRSIDSPLHAVMNVVFVLQGVLFLAAAAFAVRAARSGARRVFLLLALVHAVGMALVGIVHGSQANVENGLAIFHVVGAALAIIAGNTAAILAGVSSRRIGAPNMYRVASIVLGILGLVALIMLEVDSNSVNVTVFPDGVWERGAVYTINAWEVLTGIALLVRGTKGRA